MIPKLVVGLFICTTLVQSQMYDYNMIEETNDVREKKPKVVGGEFVRNIQYFPYIVALYGDVGKSKHANYVCAGTLIDPEWVLTAGHCVIKPEGSKLNRHGIDYVIAGVATLHSLFRQMRKTKRSIVHPLYDSKFKLNDLALIQLAHPFKMTAFVNVKDVSPQLVMEGKQRCQVLVWVNVEPVQVRKDAGPTAEEIGTNLKITTVNTIKLDECREFYKFHTKLVTDDNVCTSAPIDDDLCKGPSDSGSPLLCNNMLYGVASWSMGCAMEGDFEVWTRLESHTKWINDTLLKKEEEVPERRGLNQQGLFQPTVPMIMDEDHKIFSGTPRRCRTSTFLSVFVLMMSLFRGCC